MFFQQSLNAGGFPFEVNENNAEIIKAKAMARLIKIIYKHQAVLDIRQTQEYIAQTLGNKKAAQKLVASILKAISLLEENPMMGISMEARFEKNFYTFFVVAKHLVFYEISEDNMLSILRVLDGQQDYLAILFG